MLTALDPKYKKWGNVKEDLQNIVNDVGPPGLRNDNAMCLMHGFHHQVTFSFKDHIQCVACKSSSSREEFLVNHGGEQSNVLHVRRYIKRDQDNVTVVTQKDFVEATETYNTRFPIKGPPLHFLEWIPKHSHIVTVCLLLPCMLRLFVAFGSNKHLQVFADTFHRCKPVSAPTVCPMPVLSLVYLEATDEIVTGGIGVIQPWKLRLSTFSVQTEEVKDTHRANQQGGRNNPKIQNGVSQASSKLTFGPGRQMFQSRPPYPCDLNPDDWVLRMRVYQSTSPIPSSNERLLVALCHATVLAIDYVKKYQLWCVRLYMPPSLSPRENTESRDRGDGSTSGRKLTNKQQYIHGHQSLRSCEFFPLFGYFFTGGGEGTIRVWHVINFGLITILSGHLGPVVGLVSHPKYPMLISASSDCSIRIWCLETFTLTQRIDTEHVIQTIKLSSDYNYFYYCSKKEVCVYRLTNLYYLYSVLHSSAVKLTRVKGHHGTGVPGKVLASLQDGSVAVLCPLTGLLLTFIYPMITFRAFSDVLFDPFRNSAFIRVQSGSVMQCDSRTNPSVPRALYTPTQPYDQDVISFTSLILPMMDNVLAVIAGLRNGQIVLVYPNKIYMPATQAHSAPVEYLGMAELPYDSTEQPEITKRTILPEALVSVGKTTARSWSIFVEPLRSDERAEEWLVTLQLDLTIALPACIYERSFFCILKDRLCVCTRDNKIYVLVLQPRPYKKESRKDALCVEEEDTNDEAANMRFGTPSTGNRLIVVSMHDTDLFKTHHQDDEHVTSVTAMESSPELSIFASASNDCLVKMWDEENRLIRELLFAPHHISALCFPNGRDLVVALDGRLCMVDICTYMTKWLIKDRNVDALEFPDDIDEPAIPFNNEIQTILKFEEVSSTPLEALERTDTCDWLGVTRDVDETLHLRRNAVMTGSTDIPANASLDENAFIKLRKTLDLWRKSYQSMIEKRRTPSPGKRKSFKTLTACQLMARERWRYAIEESIRSVREKKSLSTIASSGTSPASDSDLIETEARMGKNLSSKTSTMIQPVKEKDSLEGIDLEGIFDRMLAKRLLYSKYPIAPDGHIQNSVIRQRVKPPDNLLERVLIRRGAAQGRKLGLEDTNSWSLYSDPKSLTEFLQEMESVDDLERYYQKYKLGIQASLIRDAKATTASRGTHGSQIRFHIQQEQMEVVSSRENLREDGIYLADKEMNELWEDAVKKILLFNESENDKKGRKSARIRRKTIADVSPEDTLRKSKSDLRLPGSTTDDLLKPESSPTFGLTPPKADLGAIASDQGGRRSGVNKPKAPLTGLSVAGVKATLRKSKKGTKVLPTEDKKSISGSPTEPTITIEDTQSQWASPGNSDYDPGSIDGLDGRSMLDASNTDARSRFSSNRSSRVASVTSQDILMAKVKDKLKERRKSSVEMSGVQTSGIPQVLKEIIEAPWFRKKLKMVTPDTVVDALLQIGATTRLFAHEKAIEGMLLVSQEYPEQEKGSLKALSHATMEKIQAHLARFMKASHDITNEFGKHPMRVQLAENALDALISGIPVDEKLRQTLIDLLTDENENLRKKARDILENKCGIDVEVLLKDMKTEEEQAPTEKPPEQAPLKKKPAKGGEAMAVRRRMERRVMNKPQTKGRLRRENSFQVIPLKSQDERAPPTPPLPPPALSSKESMDSFTITESSQAEPEETSENASSSSESADEEEEDEKSPSPVEQESKAKRKISAFGRPGRNEKPSVAQMLTNKWRRTGAIAPANSRVDDEQQKVPKVPKRKLTRERKRSLELRAKSPERQKWEKKQFEAKLRQKNRSILPLIAEAFARTQDKVQTQRRLTKLLANEEKNGRQDPVAEQLETLEEKESSLEARTTSRRPSDVTASPGKDIRRTSSSDSLRRVTLTESVTKGVSDITVEGSRLQLQSVHELMAQRVSKLFEELCEEFLEENPLQFMLPPLLHDMPQSEKRLSPSPEIPEENNLDQGGHSAQSYLAEHRAKLKAAGRLFSAPMKLRTSQVPLQRIDSGSVIAISEHQESSSLATGSVLPDESQVQFDQATSVSAARSSPLPYDESEICFSPVAKSESVSRYADHSDMSSDRSRSGKDDASRSQALSATPDQSQPGSAAISRSRVTTSRAGHPRFSPGSTLRSSPSPLDQMRTSPVRIGKIVLKSAPVRQSPFVDSKQPRSKSSKTPSKVISDKKSLSKDTFSEQLSTSVAEVLSDSEVAEVGLSDSKVTEVGQSDSKVTEVGQSDWKVAEVGQSDSKVANISQSESKVPVVGQSDSKVAEFSQSDSKVTEFGQSDSKVVSAVKSSTDSMASDQSQKRSSVAVARSLSSYERSVPSKSKLAVVQLEAEPDVLPADQHVVFHTLPEDRSKHELGTDKSSAHDLVTNQSEVTLAQDDRRLPELTTPEVGGTKLDLLKSYRIDTSSYLKATKALDFQAKGSNLPAIGKEPLPEDKTHLPADEAKLPEPVLHLPPIKRVYEPKIKRAVMPTEVKPQPRQVKRQEKKMMAMEEKEENWRGALLKLKKIRSKTNDSLRKPLTKRAVEIANLERQRDFPEHSVQIAPGERIVAHYSLAKPRKTAQPEKSQICSLPSKNTAQVCQRGAGESRYGIMSVHWKGRKMPKIDRETSLEAMTCRTFNQHLHVKCCMESGDVSSTRPIARKAARPSATEDVRRRLAVLINAAKSRGRGKHRLCPLDREKRTRDSGQTCNGDRITWDLKAVPRSNRVK